MNQRIKFRISVSFGKKSFRIGDEANSDELPRRIFNNLLANDVIEIISEDEPEEVESVDEIQLWTLKTPPDVYLEKTPDGPSADLARRILGIE